MSLDKIIKSEFKRNSTKLCEAFIKNNFSRGYSSFKLKKETNMGKGYPPAIFFNDQLRYSFGILVKHTQKSTVLIIVMETATSEQGKVQNSESLRIHTQLILEVLVGK